MGTPKTYSDWVVLLERFGNGDETVLDEMNTGHFVLDAGTAQRFYLRVEDAYKKRKQDWLNKFQKSFQIQNIRTDDDFATTLWNGKQGLVPLLKFISAKGFPDDLRNTLLKDLIDFISEIKQSLKNRVPKTGNSSERLLAILNTFKMPEIMQEPPAQKIVGTNSSKNIPVVPGRKIIF